MSPISPISQQVRNANRRLFGIAHAARSLGWSCVDLLLTWHLHVVAGLTGEQTGWLLFAFLTLGGVANLMVGTILTWLRADGAIVVKVQLWASMGAGVLLGAQFVTADLLPVIGIGVAFRIVYAVQDVAQNMLGSLLPGDNADATGYARLRVTLSAGMRCLVVAAYAATMQERHALPGIIAMIVLAMIGSAFRLQGLVFPPRSGPQGELTEHSGLPAGLPMLLLAFAASAMVLPTLSRLLIFSPAMAETSPIGAWLLAAFCLGSVVGPSIESRLRWQAFVAAIGLSGLVLIVSTTGEWRMAGAVVHGMAISALCARLWASAARIAMADAQNGYRRDGIVFGAVILVIHLSGAVGMLVLGPLIEGFETGDVASAGTALALTIVGALAIGALDVNGRRSAAAA